LKSFQNVSRFRSLWPLCPPAIALLAKERNRPPGKPAHLREGDAPPTTHRKPYRMIAAA